MIFNFQIFVEQLINMSGLSLKINRGLTVLFRCNHKLRSMMWLSLNEHQINSLSIIFA